MESPRFYQPPEADATQKRFSKQIIQLKAKKHRKILYWKLHQTKNISSTTLLDIQNIIFGFVQ